MGGAGGPSESSSRGWFGALPTEGLAEPLKGLELRGLIEIPGALLKEGSYS
jgi:hypothetical protein